MFDSSVLDVGATFTIRQVSDEVSRVLKKSGITGVPRLLLIFTIFSSKKWTNLLARSPAEELVGKRFICLPVKKTSNCAKQGFAVTFS